MRIISLFLYVRPSIIALLLMNVLVRVISPYYTKEIEIMNIFDSFIVHIKAIFMDIIFFDALQSLDTCSYFC